MKKPTNEPALEAAGFKDLDGTWFRKQLFVAWIEELVRAGLMPQLVLDIPEKERDLAKQRKIPYDDYIWKQVRAYQDHGRMRGIRVEDAKFCARRAIERKGHEVHVFTRELSAASKDVGIRRVIVSGSPYQVVEEFALINDIKLFMGTEHPFDKKGFFTGGKPIQHFLDKAKAVRTLAAAHRLDLRGSYAIGDSSSDAPMFEVVRYPICFNPEVKLRPIARKKRWPIIIEEKNCIFAFRPGKDGRLKEIPLARILPGALAARLSERLIATGWYKPYFDDFT